MQIFNFDRIEQNHRYVQRHYSEKTDAKQTQSFLLLENFYQLKNRSKVDKSDEVIKSVMSDLRVLANMYLKLKQVMYTACKKSDAYMICFL